MPYLSEKTVDEFMLSLHDAENTFSIPRFSYERASYEQGLLFVTALT